MFLSQEYKKKISCICLVFSLGLIPDLKRIKDISKKYNIKIIFDAACSFGQKFHNEKLSKYFSPQVYDSIFSGELDVKIQTQRKPLTVFFCDLQGFTHLTEKLEPEILTDILTEYLTAMSRIAIKSLIRALLDPYQIRELRSYLSQWSTDLETSLAVEFVSLP